MRKKFFIHPYTVTRLAYLEDWLSKKADNGWELVENKGWIFVFKPISPQRYQYVLHYDVPGGIARNEQLYETFKRLYSKYSIKKRSKERRKPSQYLEFFITTELDKYNIKQYKISRAKDYKKKSLSALIVFFVLSMVLLLALCIEGALFSKAGIFWLAWSAMTIGYFGLSYISN